VLYVRRRFLQALSDNESGSVGGSSFEGPSAGGGDSAGRAGAGAATAVAIGRDGAVTGGFGGSWGWESRRGSDDGQESYGNYCDEGARYSVPSKLASGLHRLGAWARPSMFCLFLFMSVCVCVFLSLLLIFSGLGRH